MKVVVFDLKKMRPACAILQSALRGTPGLANLFPTESWLTEVTPDLKPYEITDEQLAKLVARMEELWCHKGTGAGATIGPEGSHTDRK
jgi:hypothetical protein